MNYKFQYFFWKNQKKIRHCAISLTHIKKYYTIEFLKGLFVSGLSGFGFCDAQNKKKWKFLEGLIKMSYFLLKP